MNNNWIEGWEILHIEIVTSINNILTGLQKNATKIKPKEQFKVYQPKFAIWQAFQVNLQFTTQGTAP